ncbi:uncharacterized protein TNCV_4013291 [Trichonephila clavipes]|nr:uncharacterized protein TNCV_4013291 [Trichonephila clavipes]
MLPSRHGGTINNRPAASPHRRFLRREERWEALTTPCVLSQNWRGNEPKRTCIVLKATANERRHLALCHDEFRGPRFYLVPMVFQSGCISNNYNCISIA